MCGVKIVQYTLSKDSMNLQATLTNSGFDKEIQIYRSSQNNHYQGVHSLQKMDEMAFAQNIVLSVSIFQ